jgi:FkbM family methyltransferase
MSSGKVLTLLGKVPGVSHVLRWAARHYPEGSVVRIRHGSAAGLCWRRHHRYVNGYWIGHYELAIQQALGRELRGGDTFYDIGANAGFFSLVGARCVGPFGQVVAFDPSPDNVESIAEQVELNGLEKVIHWTGDAMGAVEGEAEFAYAGPGSPMGHLGPARTGEEAIRVRVTTLDAAVKRFGAPDFIKLDVEGAEANVLEGAVETLARRRPGWLIEIHGAAEGAEVRGILADFGYQFYELDGRGVSDREGLPHHVLARAG